MNYMSIAQYAKGRGVSPQYVYKVLKNKGIAPSALRDPATGEITQDGVNLLDKLIDKPSAVNHQPPVTVEKVDQLHQLEELRAQISEEKHRAELAEARLAAAVEERDFLRQQLDTAIKATAIAAAKRINSGGADPTEDASAEAVEVREEGVPGIRSRLRKAWEILRGKDN